MKKGWKVKKLGDVCEFDKTPNSKSLPYIGLEHIESNTGRFIGSTHPQRVKSLTFAFSREHVLYGRLRPYLNKALVPDFEGHCSTEIFPIRVTSRLDRRFLFLWLLSDKTVTQIDATCTGARMPRANMNAVLDFEIHLPPLPEQKRIVGILDKAFAAISTAKENAEKNLANARELFESYLQSVFANPGDGWEEKKLAECFKLKSGDNLTSKMMIENGKFPVYGGNGIAGMYDSFNLSGSNIIVGRVGALCGNVRYIKDKIWLTDNAFKITDWKYDFDHAFLAYLLNFKNLRGYARQAAQPVISNSSLEGVLLQFPKSKEEQKRIVAKLNALSAETKKLEAIYKQKLADLDELKKSVLQKAFSGELPIDN